MKKFTHPLIYTLAFVLLLLQSCFVKDRAPEPVAATSLIGTQSLIYTQNFDSSASNLPVGWSSSSDSGWAISTSSTNASTGYTGASGHNCIKISNSTVSGGTYNLDSRSISTLGYTNISLTYAVRRTKNFPNDGSAVSLFWSSDGGKTWNQVIYLENSADSNWAIINNGGVITLPDAASGQASLIVRWTANTKADADGGTYSIDDFQLYGSK